jgi:hypothetical protein
MVGSVYEVKGHPLKPGTTEVDESVSLDMNALFTMDAVVQRSCSDIGRTSCPWTTLDLHQALGEHSVVDGTDSAFTGVRVSSSGRVLQAQATGRYRGAPGDCACMLLQVIAPVTLEATLDNASRGQLRLDQPGVLVGIPFDYAGPRGDQFYSLKTTSGDAVTDYVRVMGELDGMTCEADAARFKVIESVPGESQEMTSLIERLLVCPYALASPERGIDGDINLRWAITDTNSTESTPPSPATLTPMTTSPAPAPPKGATPGGQQ